MATELYPFIIGADVSERPDKTTILLYDQAQKEPDQKYEMITMSKNKSRRTRRILRRSAKALGLGPKMFIMVYQVLKTRKPKRKR
jgi:hypothetical protein